MTSATGPSSESLSESPSDDVDGFFGSGSGCVRITGSEEVDGEEPGSRGKSGVPEDLEDGGDVRL